MRPTTWLQKLLQQQIHAPGKCSALLLPLGGGLQPRSCGPRIPSAAHLLHLPPRSILWPQTKHSLSAVCAALNTLLLHLSPDISNFVPNLSYSPKPTIICYLERAVIIIPGDNSVSGPRCAWSHVYRAAGRDGWGVPQPQVAQGGHREVCWAAGVHREQWRSTQDPRSQGSQTTHSLYSPSVRSRFFQEEGIVQN